MCIKTGPKNLRLQAGLTMIELILFIVIVSIGVVGILSVMNFTTSRSADPLPRKQAIAIAESLLEEIQIQPFTYCDPDDANVSTATSATVGAGISNCQTTAQILKTVAPYTSPSGEGRYADPLFDNVADYNGLNMSGIRDITNTAISGLEGYRATVSMTNAGATFGLTAAEVLQIDVQVTGPSGTDVTLRGYRFRYAPNSA